MLGALLYLRLTSLKNWLRSRVRRLRQPKYLAGLIVGAAYFFIPLIATMEFSMRMRRGVSRCSPIATRAVVYSAWAAAAARVG